MLDPSLRASLYETLARIFDGDLPPAAALPSTREPAIAPRVEALRSALQATSPETFAADHVALFVNAPGGVTAPPYASCYVPGGARGATCAWVERAYAGQGIERDPAAGEPADYLPAELEFLFFLTRHELAATATADVEALASIRAATEAFAAHVASWVPRFARRISDADAPVIAAALDLLQSILESNPPTTLAAARNGWFQGIDAV